MFGEDTRARILAVGAAAGVVVAAALLLSSTARASCDPGHASISVSQPITPAERFASLQAALNRPEKPGASGRWRALIDTIEHAPDADQVLLARSYAGLATALGPEDKVAAGLVAGHKAEQIIIDHGLTGQPVNAEILAVLAAKETNAGKAAEAAVDAQRALDLSLAAFGENSAEAALTYNTRAIAAMLSGNYRDAEHDMARSEALSVRCLPTDDIHIVHRMSGHAAALGLAGQPEEALALSKLAAERALESFATDPDTINYTLSNYGTALFNVNRLEEAEQVLREVARQREKSVDDTASDRAIALYKLANVLGREAKYEEAEALWLKARDYLGRSEDRSFLTLEGNIFRAAADSAQARGDLPVALDRRAEAVRVMTVALPALHPELARASVEYGGTLLLAGQSAAALTTAGPAIEIVRKAYAPGDMKRLGAEMIFARIVAATKGNAAGYSLAEPVVAELERVLLDAATSRTDLVKYTLTLSASFARFTELALATHHDEQAFHALQLANLSDIVLVTSDVAARSAAANPSTATLARSLQDHIRLRQGLDRERSFAVSAGLRYKAALLTTQIGANDIEIAVEGLAIDRLFPAYRTLGRPAPVALAAFSAALTAGQVLLAPLPVDDGTLAVAVTHDGLSWARTPVTRAQTVQLVGRVRASIDAALRSGDATPVFDGAAAAALYQAIAPPPIAALLRRQAGLLYYASGSLASLPPALLVTAPARGVPLARLHWLVDAHPVTVLPALLPRSVTLPGGSRLTPRFLGVGAPDFTAVPGVIATRGLALPSGVAGHAAFRSLPSLQEARGELQAIGAALGGHDDRLLVAGEATKAALRALPLDRFGVIAFATHGLVGGDFAGLTEPALVLTPPAAPNDAGDGLLTASEIAGLHLDADWVILSACNSASGSGGGPVYGGLASAFLQAGARALLVSHWPLRDDAAALLTVDTVRGTAAGTSRARALQQAMLKLKADRRVPQAAHPAIWAPFVLIDR